MSGRFARLTRFVDVIPEPRGISVPAHLATRVSWGITRRKTRCTTG